MVRDAEQQVPRGKTSGLREAKRRGAADVQLKSMERCETGLALQAGLACSTDLRCIGVLRRHSLRVFGRLVGRERGFLLGARNGLWL